MSALLAVTAPDRAFLMADAAVYDRNGVLTDIRSKTVLLPHMKAAGSCRGNLLPLALMSTALEDFANWDAFRPNAPAVFQAMDLLMSAVVPGRFYEFCLVGWSDDRGRAEVVFHATHPQIPPGFNVGGPTLITDCLIPRGPGLEELFEIEPAVFDPVANGLPAFDVAHRTPADLHCGQEPDPLMAYSVGGFVQCVTITPDGIRSEILREWPDEVGRPIEPHKEAVRCLAA